MLDPAGNGNEESFSLPAFDDLNQTVLDILADPNVTDDELER